MSARGSSSARSSPSSVECNNGTNPSSSGGAVLTKEEERVSHARRPGHARGRAASPLLAPGGYRAGADRRAAHPVRAHPGRGPGPVQGQERERRPDPGPLRPPRRLADVRPGRGAGHLLRLPRLAVRHRGQLPGDAGRARRQQVPPDRQDAGLPGAEVHRHVLGLPRPAARARDPALRRLGAQGRPSRSDSAAAARLQLDPADGELHRPGPPADPAPEHRLPRPSARRARRAASPTMSRSSTSTRPTTGSSSGGPTRTAMSTSIR